MSETTTTTNGRPVRLVNDKGRTLVSLDELVEGLSASGSSQDVPGWIQSNPEARHYLERHQGDPVPRNRTFRRGLWVYLAAMLLWVAFWAAFAWWIMGATP